MSICIAETKEFISQYKTRPAGKKANITPNIRGMNLNIFACIGSIPAGCGCSICMAHIAPILRIGSINKGSLEDKSVIQIKKGAYLSSTVSIKTQ